MIKKLPEITPGTLAALAVIKLEIIGSEYRRRRMIIFRCAKVIGFVASRESGKRKSKLIVVIPGSNNRLIRDMECAVAQLKVFRI